MHYMGGKYRLKRDIASVIRRYRDPHQIVVEPFVGAANVTTQLNGVVLASDIDKDLIAMWNAAQTGWIPPTEISEEQYYTYRDNPALLDHKPYERGFIKHGCAFGGTRWGSYAKNKRNTNFADVSSRGVVKKVRKLDNVSFFHGQYTQWSWVSNVVIYCDPPYQNTYGYGVDFNHAQFWQWVNDMSQNNIVLVSEYTAPEFMVSVWDKCYKVTMSNSDNKDNRVSEQVFIHERYKGVQ